MAFLLLTRAGKLPLFYFGNSLETRLPPIIIFLLLITSHSLPCLDDQPRNISDPFDCDPQLFQGRGQETTLLEYIYIS